MSGLPDQDVAVPDRRTSHCEPDAPRHGADFRVIERLGSLRLTLLGLLCLLGALAFIYENGGEAESSALLAFPLALLSINLLAAIATNRLFRRQLPLLLFHLCLLAIIVLAAVGRLSYLRATAEVVTGAEFHGLERIQAGPWHRGDLKGLRFENLGFRIDYKPGLQREATWNRVRWRDEQGITHTSEIGDNLPLVLRGYRFYTSPNKGFSAVFRWEPNNGEAQLEAVNFLSYPSNKDRQQTSGRLGGEDVRVSLNIREQLIDPATRSQFRLPGDHDVSVDFSWRLANLKPGEAVTIPSGRLAYVGLTTWMGYNVFYDWTMPWLLAACALAVLALGWHFWQKFAQRPWQAA